MKEKYRRKLVAGFDQIYRRNTRWWDHGLGNSYRATVGLWIEWWPDDYQEILSLIDNGARGKKRNNKNRAVSEPEKDFLDLIQPLFIWGLNLCSEIPRQNPFGGEFHRQTAKKRLSHFDMLHFDAASFKFQLVRSRPHLMLHHFSSAINWKLKRTSLLVPSCR